MSLQHLAFFVAAAVLVCLSPGPDILTVITRSITQGTRAGLVATLGFASGLIVHTTVAATGLAIVLRESPVAFRGIQFAGAAYLVYLAVRLAVTKQAISIPDNSGESADAMGTRPSGQLGRIYAQSILMNVLNPKVTLFFVAFLSKFGEPNGALPFWVQMVLLGGLFAACTIVCFGACALIAGLLASGLRRHPQADKPLRWMTATVFLTIAVLLIVD